MPEDITDDEILAAYRDGRNVCYSHYQVEEITSRSYEVCGECFHVFPTARALLADHITEFHLRWRARWHIYWQVLVHGSDAIAKTIYSCPHCIHDF